MKIGFIGAGTVARTIARAVLGAGHSVVLSGTKDPAALSDVVAVLGAGASAATPAEAAEADIVVLAVPWNRAESALTAVGRWDGKILADATNPFVGHEIVDVGGASTSVLLAHHAPRARIVKAFSSVTMEHFDRGPSEGSAKRVLFVSGDDPDAKDLVASLIKELGYATIDLGSLQDGGRVQQAGGPLAGHDLLLNPQ